MLARLASKLEAQTKKVAPLFARYEGELVRDGRVVEMSDAFRQFWEVSHTNFAEMVVKAPLYRMSVAAIRTGSANDDLGDSVAWNTCRTAGLLAALPDALRTMKIAGNAYLMVGRPGGRLTVTAEDPRQVVTIHDPQDQRIVLYGAKFYHDREDGKNYAYLHTPGRVRVAFMDGASSAGRIAFTKDWSWDEARGGVEGLPTGLDVTAIKRLRNDEGVGEFERHVNLLDRIDHITLQGMVIATMQAFKQRALELEEDVKLADTDERGNPIDWNAILTSAPDKMWRLPAGVKIWESTNVDLTPIWTGTEKYIQQLSAVTFTPLSMFSPEGQNQSAEGASLAREGLVAKTELCLDRISEDLADVVEMLFHLSGDAERANRSEIVIDWKPVERYGLAEKYQALVNAKAGDVPWRTRMAKVLQFTPSEISRMESERSDDLMLAQLNASVQASTMPAEDGSPAQGVAAPDAADLKLRFDALGTAIRAGVDPQDAAQRVGLEGVGFTGAVPVSLRIPESQADALES